VRGVTPQRQPPTFFAGTGITLHTPIELSQKAPSRACCWAGPADLPAGRSAGLLPGTNAGLDYPGEGTLVGRWEGGSRDSLDRTPSMTGSGMMRC